VSQTYSVLVADDHTRTRRMVRAALERSHAFVVCAEAADSGGAVEAAKLAHPDVCLLDINMPGNGIAAASAISEALPETAIVMFTVSRQDTDLFDALRAGASGYLLKDMDDTQLVESLHRVLSGEACLPGSLVARLVEEFRDREHRRVPISGGRTARLTGREWDVLELMRSGAPTAEIAERLFVSQTTVRSHVSAILKKLHVRDRREALQLLDHQV